MAEPSQPPEKASESIAKVPFHLTENGKDYLEPASKMLSEVFKDDPVITYMTCSLTTEQRYAYMPTYMHTLLKAGMLNSGMFQEANDWSSVALWMPPGSRVDNWATNFEAGFIGCLRQLGVGGCWRMFVHFQARVNKVKAKYLQGDAKRFYYLFFIGTRADARGQGLASEIIRQYQVKAAAEGLPIWLEATTVHSYEVYKRCGFELVEKVILGEGTHDGDGSRKKGGPGVPIFPMLWKPKRTEQ